MYNRAYKNRTEGSVHSATDAAQSWAGVQPELNVSCRLLIRWEGIVVGGTDQAKTPWSGRSRQ